MSPTGNSIPDTQKALSSTHESIQAKGRAEGNMAIVVIDPISTGASLAQEAIKKGVGVICCWSDVCPEELRSHTCEKVEYLGVVVHEAGNIEATIESILSISAVVDVICGSEPGVILTDELSAAMHLRTNGTKMSEIKINKFLQSKAARERGLATAAQTLVKSLDEVKAFLATNAEVLRITGKFKAVVKPMDGAGSEGVAICGSEEEVLNAFSGLQGTTNVLGRTSSEVLLMEFLAGDEVGCRWSNPD